MCGIVGYVGSGEAVPILLAGLHRLEYRGYDSAGIAVHTRSGLKVHKAAGKIARLEAALPRRMKGTVGIGHTRWATHGEPNDGNAHPHTDCAGTIAVVHNGIIENARELRARLEADGHVFRSETDSEVVAHLIEAAGGGDLPQAVRAALRRDRGDLRPRRARRPATRPHRRGTQREPGGDRAGPGGDVRRFRRCGARAAHAAGRLPRRPRDGGRSTRAGCGPRRSTTGPTSKSPAELPWSHEAYDRGGFAHFMLKEIMEQPEACERALKGRLDPQFGTAHLGGLNMTPRDLLAVRRVKVLGCGSAYYAGIAGAHMIEALTRVPADAEPASEFRYRNPVIEPDVLYVAVSQSGETADTLAALREVRRKGGRVLGIVNVVGSSIARECDGGIYMHAGPEVSVCSTKAFTCTLVAFALLALHLGRIRDLSPARGKRLVTALQRLPEQLARFSRRATAAALGARYAQRTNAFFIGRASGFPVALEGAQKLKEISYIHAEAYPASELKHGPLALISPETPTVVVLPRDDLYEKSLSTLEEIRARRGPVLALTHAGDDRLGTKADDVLVVPQTEAELNPILMTVPLQLLAYHAAVALGRDVDQPRNLAKSVTVE